MTQTNIPSCRDENTATQGPRSGEPPVAKNPTYSQSLKDNNDVKTKNSNDDNATKRLPAMKSRPKSILREQKRGLSTTLQFRSLLLIGIGFPTVGYGLCSILPSATLFNISMLCWLFSCFVHIVYDLQEEGNSYHNSQHHQQQQEQGYYKERRRKVQFAPMTKFHRMPRPMSRRQKADFVRRRFESPLVRAPRRRGENFTIKGQRRQQQLDRYATTRQQERESSSSSSSASALINWALLTSTMTGDSGESSDMQHLENNDRDDFKDEENNTPKYEKIEKSGGLTSSSPLKQLVGSDSPICRMRNNTTKTGNPLESKIIQKESSSPMQRSSTRRTTLVNIRNHQRQ